MELLLNDAVKALDSDIRSQENAICESWAKYGAGVLDLLPIIEDPEFCIDGVHEVYARHLPSHTLEETVDLVNSMFNTRTSQSDVSVSNDSSCLLIFFQGGNITANKSLRIIKTGQDAFKGCISKNDAAYQFGPSKAATLFEAALQDQVNAAKNIIDSGEDINATEDGLTPLHVAARKGNMAMVEFLLAHGAKPNIKSLGQKWNSQLGMNVAIRFTPIILAAQNGHIDVVRILKNSLDEKELEWSMGQLLKAGMDIDESSDVFELSQGEEASFAKMRLEKRNIRDLFAAFAGSEKFLKFMRELNKNRGAPHLSFWQEQLWNSFQKSINIRVGNSFDDVARIFDL